MTLPSRFPRALAGLAAIAAIAFVAVGSAVAANGDVSIDQLTFQPAEITVDVGDNVTWTVTNAVPEGHTVTSGAPNEEGVGDVFDSGIGLHANGETFEWTFEEAGSFPYFCKIHGAAMSGTVTVVEAGESAGPPASEAPESEAPEASEPPASEAPGASEGPPASEAPAATPGPTPMLHPTESAQVSSDRRLLAGGVLFVAILLMFGGAAIWRRMNPA